ncbi:MAG TPA: 5-oxoprolinase subunit PxpB, partial [Vicinamibacteria bacterium]|nr:5-oxoprolinase subunit PxpB [Vicinamibacteria bacterium]
MSRGARLRPVGEAALSVELGQAIDLEACRRVQALDRALRERGYAWLRETVPTYRSLLVVFDPQARQEAAARLAEMPVGDAAADPGAVHEVEVAYGGAHGPDLEAVARHCGLTPQEVVAGHAGREYFAFMLGFLPGFAYLGLLPPELETPRRATPRTRVPAGSVAVAGAQTGVYPFASPGGWNLIGRTAARLFDPGADPPARIAPGDRVRFRAVDALPAEEAAPPAAAAAEG